MAETIDETTILKLNQNILKRYEHNLKDGTMILYDIAREEIWYGNSSSKDLINLIDGKTNINDIYNELLPLYEDIDIDEVINSFNFTIEDLYNKNFIEMVKNETI